MKKALMVVSVILVILGILGFFNSPILGIFGTNTIHNIIYLVTGLVGIWATSSGQSASRMCSQWLGIIYAIITIVGFVAPSAMNFANNNSADNILHLVIAVVLLYLGYGSKKMQASM